VESSVYRLRETIVQVNQLCSIMLLFCCTDLGIGNVFDLANIWIRISQIAQEGARACLDSKSVLSISMSRVRVAAAERGGY